MFEFLSVLLIATATTTTFVHCSEAKILHVATLALIHCLLSSLRPNKLNGSRVFKKGTREMFGFYIILYTHNILQSLKIRLTKGGYLNIETLKLFWRTKRPEV